MVDSSRRVEVFSFSEAPSSARNVSSFNRDERCAGVWSVVGSDEREVLEETVSRWDLLRAGCDRVTDYDLAFDTESEQWVGTVVIDK